MTQSSLLMNPIPLTHSPGTLFRYENFPSRLVPPRHVDIWLPPGYDSLAEFRYPVLYMHDGQNLFLPGHSFGGEPWSVDKAMVRLIDEGKISETIVVGIWNFGGNRWGEYLPQKAAESPEGRAFAARFPDRLPGELYADAYLKFLVDELKPTIDSTYHTKPDQPHTFVMGSSMGGLISLYAITEYPQVFGGAGCVSTHWVAGENLMVDYFAKVLPKPGDNKIYFDFGTKTLDAAYQHYQTRMDEKMRAAGYTYGVDWLTCKFEGAEHSEQSWRERVHIPLEFLLKNL
jgi:predicted alpha/beta superfamily hydrolase